MIAHRKIRTMYQPIMRLAEPEQAPQLVGYEALSRAEPGDADRLGVHLFVAASKAELDGELDHTCRTLAVQRRPPLGPGHKLFLNCLPPAFYEPSQELELLLTRWFEDGFQPSQLVFEITETITQEQVARILPAVRRLLRRRGFLFAVDDVGTGASNLRLLADLEPDFIKMDISLTLGISQSARKQALASYLLELARRCQAELIAEGIEGPEDLNVLRALGVPYGPGLPLGAPHRPRGPASGGHRPWRCRPPRLVATQRLRRHFWRPSTDGNEPRPLQTRVSTSQRLPWPLPNDEGMSTGERWRTCFAS